MLGSVQPRLWTPPLRELTRETSYGYLVVDFARDVLGEPLDPWQEWVVVHAGELLEDGRPRFRKVLILVSRQNGKTHLLRVLSLFWLFVERVPLILGTSTNLDTAKEAWEAAVETAQSNEWLAPDVAKVMTVNGNVHMRTVDGCRYKIAASNRRGGRGSTIHRLVIDELREHRDWDAWNAAVPATNAVPGAQIFCLTNQGDDSGIVLDDLRASALAYLETGQGDPRLGLFEYSAPDGADPLDPEALAMANPQVGRRMDWDTLLGEALRAKNSPDPAALASFRTEYMCQRVHMLDPGIDLEAWAECTSSPTSLAPLIFPHRWKMGLCLDVSIDGSHACLVAAVLHQGIVRVAVVEHWEGADCTKRLRAELPELVEQMQPDSGRLAVGWFPNGPAAAVAASIREDRKGGKKWPPPRVDFAEIVGETPAVCMGLADVVRNRELRHPDDPMLTAHMQAAQKAPRGDGYIFARRKSGPIDGAYALAGAVHLARLANQGRPPAGVW